MTEKRPCFGGLTFKNRGHLGSRYIYIVYIYIYYVYIYIMYIYILCVYIYTMKLETRSAILRLLVPGLMCQAIHKNVRPM